MTLENISCQKSFGGWHKRYRHRSQVLGCDMQFAVYLPPQAEQGAKLPVLYWLSGLTCTDENFMQNAGAPKLAAGFYLNAPQQPWARNYRMYDYVVQELPALVEANFPVSDKRGISGHSMGGHGALVCALRNP